MAVGSITSAFSFKGYKVDKFSLEAKPNLYLLGCMDTVPSSEWKMNISIRKPSYFVKAKAYVGGLDIALVMTVEKERENDSDEITSGNENNDNNVLLKVHAGIAGLFSVENGKFPKETEDKLVKIQIPALLLPYLRGAVTSLLANAGFGSVLLPLFNIHALAEEVMKNIDVQIIE